jgi:FlaA1/EpsC-like NDP-sugar epimerase
VLGSTADIPEIVKQYDVGVVFYTIAHISLEDRQRVLNACSRTGLHVVMLSEVLDLLHHQLTKSGSNTKTDVPDSLVVNKDVENINA